MTIRELPFFKNGTENFLKVLEENARLQKYEKGKILFLHGDKAETFYIVKNGWVKLFRETLEGTQSIADILPQNHIFGETALFENDLYPYSAEVVESATVISLPLKALKDEIESNNSFATNMLNFMARYRRRQDMELEHLTLQNAPQRIGCFLLRLAQQDKTGKITINLPYDKTLIASRLAMQPETFSRALSKLKNKTGIRINGPVIELDNLQQISDYSCAACSSEFPCQGLHTIKQ